MSSNRPSKQALFQMLQNDLSSICGELGVDAACGTMKNAHLFKTRRYLGIDNSEEALARSSPLHGHVSSMWANLETVRLPYQEATVIVSTNTLFYVDRPLDAIANLHKGLQIGGTMLLHLSKDKKHWRNIKTHLEGRFTFVDVQYVQNPLSRLYERWVPPTLSQEKAPTRHISFRVIARLLALGERLTSHVSWLNNAVYVKASGNKYGS